MQSAVGTPHHTAMRWRQLVGIFIVTSFQVGCFGSIEDEAHPLSGVAGNRDDLPVRSCNETQIDMTPVRLLTRDEYNNTVRDLLGDDTAPLIDSPSASTGGFDNNADALSIPAPMAQHFLEVAEGIADRAADRFGTILPCTPSGDGRACAEEFITKFGRRAFRRPVPDSEKTALLGLYDVARADTDFNGAVKLLIQAMLNSPKFLYHIERGVDRGDGTAALDDYELASKLSYFLWNTMPDPELDAAADAGKLHEPDEIRAQAERLLMSDRAREVTKSMYSQWLHLDEVLSTNKDLTRYRELTDDVRRGLVKETQDFLDQVVWNDAGSVKDMFTAPYSVMNASVADFYGMKGVTSDEFAVTDLDTTERMGLLTQGSVMTILAKIDRTSPVHRGLFVRQQILCETLPPAPQDVPALEAIDPNLSVRDRLKQHREDPACAGCHKMMDPLGFAFEHFDGVGRYRDQDEKGNWVDSSSEWFDPKSGKTTKFDDAVGLSKALAEDPRVDRCMSQHWYEYAMGHGADRYDQCTLDSLQEVAETGSVQDVLLAVTAQDVFRFRAAVETGGGCQ